MGNNKSDVHFVIHCFSQNQLKGLVQNLLTGGSIVGITVHTPLIGTLIHAQSGLLIKNIYKSYDLVLAQQSYCSIAVLGSNSGMGFHSISDRL